jgi:hypothetical protein
MNRTTKTKLIALSVFALAVASAPLSIVLNAPEAKAARISTVTSVTASSLPSVPAPPVVVDLDEVKVVAKKKASRKARPAPKKAKTWTCVRRVLEQGGRPGARTVLYCDHL